MHLQLLSRNFLPRKAPCRKNIGPLQSLHACRLDVTAWDPSSLLIIFTNSYICGSISWIPCTRLDQRLSLSHIFEIM